jgi:hypothetical protein
MRLLPKRIGTTAHFRSWPLPFAVTLGSDVRAKGILLEIRAGLPFPVRKLLDVKGSSLTLAMQDGDEEEAQATAALVEKALPGMHDLPVIPREIQDILGITSTERRRWLEDGRLPSAGTRTVRLQGRARRITFHVFDPRLVEGLLDSGKVDEWREEDAIAAAERRRQAAWKAKATRTTKKGRAKPVAEDGPDASAGLKDWDDFLRDGLLR